MKRCPWPVQLTGTFPVPGQFYQYNHMLGGGNTIYHVKRVGFMCDIAPLSVWKEALEMQYALIVQWVPYPPSTGFSWDEVMTVQQAMTRVELLGVNGPIDGLEWNLK